MKVLLVDDQPLFLEGFANLLDTHGIEVVGRARDGREALDRARDLCPDVVLMDVEMPHCDGLEATRRIKAEMPDVKIVLFSVSPDDYDLREAIRCGASGYMLKDLSATDLFGMLSRLVNT